MCREALEAKWFEGSELIKVFYETVLQYTAKPQSTSAGVLYMSLCWNNAADQDKEPIIDTKII